MPALPQYYVDPASGSDISGTGAIGSPWQTLQHALDTITPATYGDQINLKSGSSNILSADLSYSTYSPSTYKKLVVRGYTTTENDGGIGKIDGSASYTVGSLSNTAFIDLEITNTDPARSACSNLDYSQWVNVYAHTIDNNVLAVVQNRAQVIDCRFENISGSACNAFRGFGKNLYFKNGSTYSFGTALKLDVEGHLSNSIFDLDGSSNGIDCVSISHCVMNSTFFGGGGTGTAYNNNSSDTWASMFADNIVAGFSGTGGIGCNNTSYWGLVFRNNSFYDNATDFNDPTTAGESGYRDNSGNESLASSPFALSGNNDYANRLTYFAPQDVGSVLAGDYPRGAVFAATTSGGGGATVHPLRSN